MSDCNHNWVPYTFRHSIIRKWYDPINRCSTLEKVYCPDCETVKEVQDRDE